MNRVKARADTAEARDLADTINTLRAEIEFTKKHRPHRTAWLKEIEAKHKKHLTYGLKNNLVAY